MSRAKTGTGGMLVGLLVLIASPELADAQYATTPDGQYAGRVQASPIQKKAGEVESFVAVEPHVGYLQGHTRYRIHFPVYEGESSRLLSELEFPMDSAIAGIGVSLGRKDIWNLGFSITTNVTEDTGKMKDSDWFDENPATKSLYSESDTKMDILLIDVGGTFNVLQRDKTSLDVMIGYRYQNMDFENRNLNQVCLTEVGCAVGGSGSVSGKVLAYKMTYQIPYGGLAVVLRPSTRVAVRLAGALGRAYGKDEDDHILRGKKSSAEADGPFYLLKGEGQFAISNKMFLDAGLEYLKIDAEGKQNQVCYTATPGCPFGEGTAGIDYKAQSEQTTVKVGLRYVW